MEILDFESIINSFSKYVDWQFLIVFMCITYVSLAWLHSAIMYVFSIIIRKRLVVFLIGTIVAFPYWFYFKHDPIKLLTTWAVGMASHDYVISLAIEIFKKLKRKILD